MRKIGFDIRTRGSAVENVIGGEVDELRVDLAAGDREISHSQSIYQEGGLRLSFSDVDVVIGGGIEDDFRVGAGERALDGFGIGDIDLAAVPGHHGVMTGAKLANELDAELAGGAEDHHGARHKAEFTE